MATIGQSLTAPETGWKRYDNAEPIFKYEGTWATATNLSVYKGSFHHSSTMGVVKFRFYGTKLRFIGAIDTERPPFSVKIDNETITGTENGSPFLYQVLLAEKTGLQLGYHDVEIKATSITGNAFIFDAIDIDSNGRLLHPQEVTNVKDLETGKRIRFNYIGTTGTVGAFSNLGKETSPFIPITSSATPDGDAYFIMVDTDFKGRKILIADRNIQQSISYDAINREGMVSGLSINTEIFVDSANGNDANNGSVKNPVKTLKTAINKASKYSTIVLDKGIYKTDIGSGYLHDLVTPKCLSFIGKGKDTVIELQAGAQSFGQGSSTGANFSNLLIRPSNTYSGDVRTLWYNTDNYKPLFLNFENVVFTKSLNNTYPTSGAFVFGNSYGTPNYSASFVNCSAVSFPSGKFEDNGYARLKKDSSFSNTTTLQGITENCIVGATHDADYRVTSANNGSGVYYGKYNWNVAYQHQKSETLSTLRILSGGTLNTDKDNEWDKYISTSTLNGTITAGDNAVWNWSTVYSWTSTTTTAVSSNRTIRGNTAKDGFTYTSTDSSSTTRGFRPVFLIEDLKIIRYLIKDIDGIKKYNDNSWSIVTTGNPTDDDFKNDGMNSLSSLANTEYQLLKSPFEILAWTDNKETTIKTNVSGIETDKYKYKVEMLNPYILLKDFTNATNNVADSVMIPISTFTTAISPYNIKVTAEQVDKAIEKSTTLILYDTEPTLIATYEGGLLNIDVGDKEGDKVQFKYSLNGKQIYPETGFTNLSVSPVAHSRVFTSNDILIDRQNIIDIVALDEFGKESNISIQFLGEYSGLMFADQSGKFFSNDLGEILQYLDFGIIIAGQVTIPQKVRVINKNAFSIANMNITLQPNVYFKTKIEMSKTEEPFVPESMINFSETLLKGEERSIFVRIVTDKTDDPHNTIFEIKAEADPI